jgi:diguanylate cyclase (GGDEF)-like protein
MNGSRTETASALQAMFAIVAIVFVAEIVIMAVLAYLEVAPSQPLVVVVAGIALAAITAPPIYWLVLIPIRREHEKRREAEAQAADLGQLTITDELTRVMNRRGITVALLDSMAQAERYDTPLTIAMADLDSFRKVNDDHGRQAGDTVLMTAASILEEALRMPDKVGRFGAEEFLVILPHTPLAQGRTISERIRAAVAKHPATHGDTSIPTTVSLGVTQYRKGEDLQQLLARVEQALSEAKAGGRNCVVARKN